MRKPDNFEIKQFIYDNYICGLQVIYPPETEDRASTSIWALTTIDGECMQFPDDEVRPLVSVQVTHNTVLCLNPTYEKEMEDWIEFVEEEEADWKQLQRLKKKFGEHYEEFE